MLTVHVIVCILLVIIVLLQSGKSADLAGAFGMMGSQSTFGPRGAASFLSKMTTTLAITFMITSLGLYIIGANKASTKGKSILSGSDIKTTSQKPISQPTRKPYVPGSTVPVSPAPAKPATK